MAGINAEFIEVSRKQAEGCEEAGGNGKTSIRAGRNEMNPFGVDNNGNA